MTSYELNPGINSDKLLIGPSFGNPDYKIISNNDMNIRSLNQFDKTFQSSLQNEQSNQFGLTFNGGKGKGKQKKSRIIKKNKKISVAKKTGAKKTMKKKRVLHKPKKTRSSSKKYKKVTSSSSRRLFKKRVGGQDQDPKPVDASKVSPAVPPGAQSVQVPAPPGTQAIESEAPAPIPAPASSFKIGGNRSENIGTGYTMDTKNTDTLNGALATPFNLTSYKY